MRTISVPGKLFVMGEYGVIEGGAAFLCTLKPSYVFEGTARGSEEGDEFHPGSPLGRWISSQRSQVTPVRLVGAGLGPGFGSSTAELIAGGFFHLGHLPETSNFWLEYRARHPEASGSDLAVQLEAARGRGPFFRVSVPGQVEILPRVPLFEEVLLFQREPSRKLKTHEDLARVDRAPLDRKRFDALLSSFEEKLALRRVPGRWSSEEVYAFFAIWDEFADFLEASGRETPDASRIRKALRGAPGVMGVKGCGAGLNDAFLVACPEDRRDGVIEAASRLGLRYLGVLAELLS